MAKRKLSESQRKALREEIHSRQSAGVPRSQLVKTLAAKFRISPISMKWYLRTQPPATESRSPGPVSVLPYPAAAPTPAAPPNGHSAINGGNLLDLLSGMTQKKIKRLMEAKKLIPKLALFRRHETQLRGQIRQLEKRLESEVVKARSVEEKIKKLAGI